MIFYEVIRRNPHRLMADLFEFPEILSRDYSDSKLAKRINERTASAPMPEPLRSIAAKKDLVDINALAQGMAWLCSGLAGSDEPLSLGGGTCQPNPTSNDATQPRNHGTTQSVERQPSRVPLGVCCL